MRKMLDLEESKLMTPHCVRGSTPLIFSYSILLSLTYSLFFPLPPQISFSLSLSLSMADQFSPCLITAMDHLWFHGVVLFPEPNALAFKTLNPTSSRLSLCSSLDEFEELPSTLEDEEESSDSSQINTPQDDSYSDDEEEEEEEEEEEDRKLKERTAPLNHNRSGSFSPSTPKRSPNSAIKLQKSMSCRSSMELELEEVKGFMDLGFRFNEEDMSPRMMSVLPGLQRARLLHGVAKGYNQTEQDGDYEKGKITRPYLSEAWLIKRPDSPLIALKIPRFTAAADMKKHLQFWAKTVASAVQQEC